MDKRTENEILQYVSYSDYQKGKNYFIPYVEYMGKKQEENELIHNFRVESERTISKYQVIIKVDLEDREIKSTYCSCPQFRDYDSCKHVAACLCNYYDELIPKYITKEDKLKFTKELYDIFSNFDKDRKKSNKKEEVKLDVYLYGGNNEGYSVDSLSLELKIGTTKQYSCKERKLSQFLEAYNEQREYYFGKSFNYDPNNCYFNEENKKILDFLVFLNEHRDSYYTTYQLIKGSKTIKDFLELLKNKRININDYIVLGYEKGFPIPSKLKKEGEEYHLYFELNTELYFLTKDLEWIQKKNRLFKLGNKEKTLLVKLVNEDMNEIIIDQENKNNFSKYILPSIHQNIEIEEGIEEFKVSKTITPKLYFDILRDKLSCKVKFLYDEEEIDYFDEGTTVVRNNDFELEVIQDLLSYSFVEEKKNFLLKEMDEVGDFLENKINELSEKYEVYTSEKLKELKVIKKPTVKSTFSTGKDNIMSYSFQMNDVDDNELSLLMSAYKNKKKYYRLKSGDLVNLENSTDLDELNNLMEDMNISSKDLDKGNLSLPKYRAIYLDSLKRSKYHIIETNNLFDELIEKFEKYKDAEVSLSKKEENLLRDYQKDGVKWLCNIDKTGFGGILADEMGLGKSIQTIYYMKELLKEDQSYQFLIVVPTSLAYNWENEFDKFEPKMKKIIMVGNRKIRREKFEHIKDYNIIVTTYGLLREDQDYYKDLHFKTVIIDEAQNIKNTNTEITKSVKNIKADTFLALTGTPIENSIDELWSIFDFIMPGFLPEMTQFDKKFRIKDFDE
ncbi:MAG: SNF2 helicase associated domain-containing protein, partial [Bacilli bacterium]|nr:SNF2 helicase associated domain-containing protein [Bacilli bacterium]